MEQPSGDGSRDMAVTVGEWVEIRQPRDSEGGEEKRGRRDLLRCEVFRQPRDKQAGTVPGLSGRWRDEPYPAVQPDDSGAVAKAAPQSDRDVRDLVVNALQSGQRQFTATPSTLQNLD
jgi:hypothetical protein